MSNYDNAYGELQSIINNINVLFEEFELPLLDCDVVIPGTLLLFIENIASSGTIEKNIKEINKQLEEIVATHEQTICVDEFEEDLSESSEKTELKNNEDSDELFDGNNVIPHVESKSVFEADENEQTDNSIEQSAPAAEQTVKTEQAASDDKALMNMIMSVIGMRDNLILRQGMIELQNPELASYSTKIIDTVINETTHMLKQNDVEVLDNDGMFDTALQVIAGIKKTEDQTLENVVATTSKIGYKYKDKLIRPQEVIVYQYEKEGE